MAKARDAHWQTPAHERPECGTLSQSLGGAATFELAISPTNFHAGPAYACERGAKVAACAKAIIVGEHAVVYGARAIAMPVASMSMQLSLTRLTAPLPTDANGRAAVQMTLGGQKVSDHLHGVVYDAFDVLGIPAFPIAIEGHSNVLIGAGLGSSASLCIGVLRGIAAACGVHITKTQLAAYGNQLERRFHGNPSGLDTAVVAIEQVIQFARSSTPEFIDVAALRTATPGKTRPWHFALLDSGSRSSTKAMIQIAKPYFQGSEGARRIKAFDRLADEVTRGLGTGQADVVAAAMNEAAIRLAGAGIVSPRLRDMMATADAVGALASKPTGAGGGGCILALLATEDAASQLAALRAKLGATRVYSVELS